MQDTSIDTQMVDIIRLIQNAKNTDEIDSIFAKLLREFGYEQSTYIEIVTPDDLGTSIVNPAMAADQAWLSKHAEQEILHYGEETGERFHTRYPFTWNTLLEHVDASPLAKRFLEKTQHFFDGKDGFIAPIHGPEGSITVLVVYGEQPDVSAETIRALGTVAFFHQAALERINNNERKGGNNNLLECIKCIALGKSDMEISHLLGISEGEVNFQINRAINGLGVSTRAQAVEEAARRNLITL
ncbi:autoinducer binding domain-containing protein [Kordiimonas sp. SCSIO 12603]|uniref:helix-turn-helix transcriptional regulator n=1 Tax=Kordiimonas sp. SCSIO 12603 TaxID=2829596 RepID=UPI0021069C73|nr:LuxR family transcriptional regulator [Kordiimonas sp. SCSIO 12603]UTW57860.1 autoinducer binding domain-containing protein [Kordiimonas sp. SCSIO 12603]